MQGLKTKWKWVVAIIAMQFITMGTVGIAPALAQIGAAFPERSAEEVQLLMSLPSLGTVIASLIAVAVAAKIGRTLFFAPLTATVPASARPPLITSILMLFLLSRG